MSAAAAMRLTRLRGEPSTLVGPAHARDGAEVPEPDGATPRLAPQGSTFTPARNRNGKLAATLDKMARRELKASGLKRTAGRSGT